MAKVLNYAENLLLMRPMFAILFALTGSGLMAQSARATFMADMANHRQHYKDDFITKPRSPLTAVVAAATSISEPAIFGTAYWFLISTRRITLTAIVCTQVH